MDSQDIYNVRKKIKIQVNAVLLNFLFCKSITWKNIITVSTKISITRNVAWAVNQHIIMISEGSCDTEDYSNDAENSALHHINKLHFTISLSRRI